MEALRNENILLSEEASAQLIREFTHPDIEALKKRDEYLNSIDVIREQRENYVNIEIPDFDLDFLNLDKTETKVTIEDSLGRVKEKGNYEFLVLKINVTENPVNVLSEKTICLSSDEKYIPVRITKSENVIYQESLSIQAA